MSVFGQWCSVTCIGSVVFGGTEGDTQEVTVGVEVRWPLER